MWLLARALGFSSCMVGRLARGIPGHSKVSWCLKTQFLPLYLLCTEGRELELCVPESLPLLRKIGVFSILLLGPLLLMCFTCLAWPVER